MTAPDAGDGARWKVIASYGLDGSAPDVRELRGEWIVHGEFLAGVTSGGGGVACRRTPGPSDAGAEIREPELDARVLAVTRSSEGGRHRSFRDGVAALAESVWEGWPVTGPRTTLWCCRFILETDDHPMARHTRWRRGAGLLATDAGVADHENADA